jgi:hypothetical protein
MLSLFLSNDAATLLTERLARRPLSDGSQLGSDPTHRAAQPEQVGDLQPFPDIEVTARPHHWWRPAARLVLVRSSNSRPAASAHAQDSAGTRVGFAEPHQLHRFTNPAEAAASLALREGKPDALDFYLDHGRIHVGDIAKTTEDAFTAWIRDRSAGLDAIMLAPTRQLVAELNRRATAIIASTAPPIARYVIAVTEPCAVSALGFELGH